MSEGQLSPPIKHEDVPEVSDDDDEEVEADFLAPSDRDEQDVPSPSSMQPVPTAPPRVLSPLADQDAQQRRSNVDIAVFSQNMGLVVRSADGSIPTSQTALPMEKSFTIQVGPEQFRLSGASLNSDAPSYFSRFFEAELARRTTNKVPASEPVKTLYVDRDPATFRDIALHLQGYHIQPRDSTHYVRLFADAQFFVLPRLIKHLWDSDVFIRIGEDEFCVPRDLFSLEPGNTPNYFTLGFGLLFSRPGNPFPGLDAAGLLRPPAIKAASASGRSGRIFADILDLLRGYEVHIRDEDHRAALLRDCRYYHLKGLEQKIIPHSQSWNEARKTTEIVLRLEDIRQSGIYIEKFAEGGLRVLRYARPFVDNQESPHELIIETGRDSATIRPANNFVVEFHNESRQRIMTLFKVVSQKFAEDLAVMGGDAPKVFIINEDGKANARIEPDAAITVDGEEGWLTHPSVESVEAADGEGDDDDFADTGDAAGRYGNKRKRRRLTKGDVGEPPPEETTREWTVVKGQWRIRLESWGRGSTTLDRNLAIHMYAVNLDVVRGQRGRNRRRGFII